MPENEHQRLNTTKIEGDTRISEYRKGLESAIDIYSISECALNHDKKTVIDGALRLLSGYDIDPLFSTDSDRNLFALAISSAWLSTESIKDKGALLDILKLVATGANEHQDYRSLSGRVRFLSEHRISRGTMFDPEASSENSHSEYISMILEYIRE